MQTFLEYRKRFIRTNKHLSTTFLEQIQFSQIKSFQDNIDVELNWSAEFPIILSSTTGKNIYSDILPPEQILKLKNDMNEIGYPGVYDVRFFYGRAKKVSFMVPQNDERGTKLKMKAMWPVWCKSAGCQLYEEDGTLVEHFWLDFYFNKRFCNFFI